MSRRLVVNKVLPLHASTARADHNCTNNLRDRASAVLYAAKNVFFVKHKIYGKYIYATKNRHLYLNAF